MFDFQVSDVIHIAKDAGKEILKIYKTDFSVEFKGDHSPLTLADKASHQVIVAGLKKITPDIPVLSEEGKDIAYEERKTWKQFWLVDPLDGTKEFIKKNGEFTVNIALIENGFPVFGVIYVPVQDVTYYGSANKAYKMDQNDAETPIHVNSNHTGSITIVESRSHPSKELEQLMGKIEGKFQTVGRIQRGSSLKFCAVAEGTADLYPRMGPTMEWDTAAGQAIVEAAGGTVETLDGKRFSYNKESLLNRFFIVRSAIIL